MALEAFLSIDWTSVASVATAAGVIVGAYGILENGKIAQSTFEDSLISNIGS